MFKHNSVTFPLGTVPAQQTSPFRDSAHDSSENYLKEVPFGKKTASMGSELSDF